MKEKQETHSLHADAHRIVVFVVVDLRGQIDSELLAEREFLAAILTRRNRHDDLKVHARRRLPRLHFCARGRGQASRERATRFPPPSQGSMKVEERGRWFAAVQEGSS